MIDVYAPERAFPEERIGDVLNLSNTADGGWGIAGHGLTNAELDDI